MSTSSHAMFGAPCWVSLMTHDLEAAQQFYGSVLDWTFRRARVGDACSVGLHEGIPVAGIGALARDLAVAVAWTPYFAVDDADVTTARIRERCATLAVGPLSFGTGRAALAADRDGAVFGIWEGEVIPDWGWVAKGPPLGSNCVPEMPSMPPSSMAKSSTGAASDRAAAKSPTKTITSCSVTAKTRWRGSAAEPWRLLPTRRSDRAGTSISGCLTLRLPFTRPLASEAAASLPWSNPRPIAGSRCVTRRVDCSPSPRPGSGTEPSGGGSPGIRRPRPTAGNGRHAGTSTG